MFAPRKSVAGAARGFARVARVAALALAALSAVPPPALAGSGVGASKAKASVDFRIVIPKVLRVRTLRQPDRLLVTPRDVSAGYVEIDRGVEVEVVSNLRGGHTVQFQLASLVVRAAKVSGLGAAIEVVGDGAAVFVPRALRAPTRSTLTLGFRLQLAKDVEPGVYDWPVSIAAFPA